MGFQVPVEIKPIETPWLKDFSGNRLSSEDINSQICITKRLFLIGGLVIVGLAPMFARAQQPGSVSVWMRTDSAVVQQIPESLRAGLTIHRDSSTEAQQLISKVPPGKAIPVVLIVVGVLSIPVLWNSVQEMLRERNWGGVIIDSRSNPATITNSAKIPANFVFIIDSDGKTTQYNAMNFEEKTLRVILPKVH